LKKIEKKFNGYCFPEQFCQKTENLMHQNQIIEITVKPFYQAV